ncbi:chemotaxis protein CheW [Chromobacterium haemolyticum]|uniref:chemotaxis protein CheW n=1 Tax=Chromobacterium haemolyticum TaxID=394935 RepID=UPI0009D94CB4|nr:chemotaxis protein CheW [Chromobacterium haemolyticum]OQS33851.1 chemotaxis protein CheA [Chromobacterium haemolyticum]
MSIDLSQFSEVFFEEAMEHLAAMESLLLACDIHASDEEQLNAIFRAAHSIKGGAGAFGFKELTSVTHVLESVLDKVRKGNLPLHARMIDGFLRARDVLAQMVLAYQHETPLPEVEIAELMVLLEALGEGKAADEVDVQSTVMPLCPAEDLSVTPPAGCLHVRIAAGDVVDDAAVQSCLSSYGAIKDCRVGDHHSPWLYVLATENSAEDIRETLTFLIHPDRLTIDSSGEQARASIDWTEECEGYGFFVPVVAGAPGVAASGSVVGATVPDAPESLPSITPLHDGLVDGACIEEVLAVLEPSRVEHEKAAPKSGAITSSIRVSVDKVDQLLNLVGELVITQSMLAQMVREIEDVAVDGLQAGVNQLERNSRELQEIVMSVRMLPISSVFQRFPRVVRDLAQQLGKEVELKMEGEHTELDKGFVEKLVDPLMHVVRNSVDHGIEAPEERLTCGKPRVGRLVLRAYQQGGDIVIEISDDGKGLHRDKIISKAKANGLPVSDNMSDRDVAMLIFEPGFSTADQVSDVSGRGVGMDVVKRNIQAMGGRVEVESEAGKGMSLIIRLPLTLAILDGMSIRIGTERYIVPLTFIIEAVTLGQDNVKTVKNSTKLVNVRGEFLPLISLREVLGATKITYGRSNLALILKSDNEKIALLIDELLGQYQVVIKNLETNYHRVTGVSGAAIMGDGRVALILDVVGLLAKARSSRIDNLANIG